MRKETKELVYIHLHASDRFVLSSGITFEDFYRTLDRPLHNLLLLKHQYEDGEYNRNTMLEFVYQEDIQKLVKSNADRLGDFCWIDFEDESGLDALDGQQIAELLYLAHCKNHLRPPFYHMLNNEFVYLSHHNDWFNKVYYRSLDEFFRMLGTFIPYKMIDLKVEKTWLGIRKKAEYPPIPMEIFIRLSSFMAEGALISFEQIEQTRNRLEIPLWVIGDYADIDEIEEVYQEQNRDEPDANLIFIRKTKEWTLALH
ncbi:MAG: hypothetical protein ACI35R_02130 [Bacillus sp. (in: firmicutes)]